MKKSIGKRRAVFLDRDGTINHLVGYVNHPSRLRLYRFSAEAIRTLNGRALPAVVITNQSGVARGMFPEWVVEETHRRMIRRLGAGGARLDGIYYCPHHPAAGDSPRRCRCRKPGTALVRRAARELEIDLARSFMVGDSPADIQMGKRIGARTILVMTGYGRGEYEYNRSKWKVAPDHVCTDLLAAVRWILDRIDHGE